MSLRKNWGLSLLEVLGALTVGASLSVVAVSESMSYLEHKKASALVEYQMEFARAAERYRNGHLQAQGLTSQKISVAELKAAGYLPASFPLTNSFGQAPCMRVSASGTAVVFAEGGRPLNADVRNRASALVGAGQRNFVELSGTQLVFWGMDVSTQFPTGCGGEIAEGGIGIAYAATVSQVPQLREIYRLPYTTSSNQMASTLSMTNNDIRNVRNFYAQKLSSSSNPDPDYFGNASATRSAFNNIIVDIPRTRQIVPNVSGTSITVSEYLSAPSVTVGNLRARLITLPNVKGKSCTQDQTGHIDGLPHICKGGIWQPIQLASLIYSDLNRAWVDRTRPDSSVALLDKAIVGCNNYTPGTGEVILSAGGSVSAESSTQNFYFEPQNDLVSSATLYSSGRGKTPKPNFYLADGTRDEGYYNYKPDGYLRWSGGKPYISNPGLDSFGVPVHYTSNTQQRGKVSGTSNFENDGSATDEAGDKIRATVVCGRGLGITTNR